MKGNKLGQKHFFGRGILIENEIALTFLFIKINNIRVLK